MGYIGRFAPSPTGPLHAGSLVAALASWLDARAHGGRWLVRIEDVDTARCSLDAGRQILKQLADLGLHSDEQPVWQSTRGGAYQMALQKLIASSLAYPCACSRSDVAAAHARAGRQMQPHQPLPYPGTCRAGLAGRAPRTWRFEVGKAQTFTAQTLVSLRVDASDSIAGAILHWTDRRLGEQSQNVANQVGDFILKRADGDWAYQLAVVVDDAAQGVTHVVRGVDLADNTPRQQLLQMTLGLDVPRYLHTPLVVGPDGAKLSKQHGAPAVPTDSSEQVLRALRSAAAVLGLSVASGNATKVQALEHLAAAWKALYNPAQ